MKRLGGEGSRCLDCRGFVLLCLRKLLIDFGLPPSASIRCHVSGWGFKMKALVWFSTAVHYDWFWFPPSAEAAAVN
jgi:hypothetical protein